MENSDFLLELFNAPYRQPLVVDYRGKEVPPNGVLAWQNQEGEVIALGVRFGLEGLMALFEKSDECDIDVAYMTADIVAA